MYRPGRSRTGTHVYGERRTESGRGVSSGILSGIIHKEAAGGLVVCCRHIKCSVCRLVPDIIQSHARFLVRRAVAIRAAQFVVTIRRSGDRNTIDARSGRFENAKCSSARSAAAAETNHNVGSLRVTVRSHVSQVKRNDLPSRSKHSRCGCASCGAATPAKIDHRGTGIPRTAVVHGDSGHMSVRDYCTT